MERQPSASYSLVIRVEIQHRAGMLGRVTSAIGAAEGVIGAVDITGFGKGTFIRDFTVFARDEDHGRRIIEEVRRVEDARVVSASDRTFLLHQGGKIQVAPKVTVRNRDDLSMVYTPGVGRICQAIAKDPSLAYDLTIKKNSVAIVTDGSAVLGLGNIGPYAALPVMEGKAVLFKEFGGIDAFPLCLATQDTEEVIRIVKGIAPAFGGINLEDISAPRCFEIEGRLRDELDIPVFHDDQHGTAVVVLAALINALKFVGREWSEVKVVISGIGAAGVAITKILLTMGVVDIIGCDRSGTLYAGRTENMNPIKFWLAAKTNPRRVQGNLAKALHGADVFIGVSGPGILTVGMLKTMVPDPIVFALANPIPEILPEEALPHARVMATGRSDYPNQINNSLRFPGFFRGLLDAQAKRVTEEMKIVAAQAIASIVSDQELNEDYIVPSMFDERVAKSVAEAVVSEARRLGV